MIRNRIICLIWAFCTVITFSGCSRWADLKNDVKSVLRYRELYGQTLSELNRIKSNLEEKRNEVKKYKDNWNQALTKADEYKDNWSQALAKADEYNDNWKQASIKADEYKNKSEVTEAVAAKAQTEVLSLQDEIKKLEKSLGAAMLENQKAKLKIIGLKQQLEQLSDAVFGM